MSDIMQSPLSSSFPVNVDFATNPEPRLPCVLLLDASGSMAGPSIDQLNEGVRAFFDEIYQNDKARKSVEVAIVSFGPVRIVSDFASVTGAPPPTLVAEADTPMGAAIMQSLDLLESRKKVYRTNGIEYYRPWIFMITDGAPTDEWRDAAQRIAEYERDKKVLFFAVGVEDADMDVLKSISVRPPLRAKGLVYREMFRWLSSSLSAVSQSNPGDKITLQPPDAWAITV